MSDNAEAGIAQTQTEASKSSTEHGNNLNNHHARGIANLDDRILVSISSIAFVGLVVVWLTATSAWLIYGSFAALIVLLVLWGVLRVKRTKRVRLEREQQAKNWESSNSK
ncbi:MAG: hypothetical protein AAF434_13620 [Pseudomonadota bacterium]